MKALVLNIGMLLCGFLLNAQIEAGLLLGLINASTAEMNALTGVETGAILYNTTEDAVYQYNGSNWSNVASAGVNLATQNLTQDSETRTYDINGQNLGLTNGKVGIGNSTPNSTLQVSGSVSMPIRTTAVNTTLDDNDYTLVMTTTKDLLITLPAASSCTGRIYILKNMGNGDNFTNIDFLKENGDPENKLTKDRIIWLQSDGVNWHQLTKD
ncbi:MAG: hypothetical protein KJP14_00995 [Eudoraea sp.]|nr:hypothetical protein [Eudoraea sp.]MBT8209084.1 hypothetical protein [Eudoraea sp.]MBT8223639.1 hypothetical protein [Eudoraea sp.]MBT8323312.1 hypothetical protein [Eudoraea sp.]NNK30431.1 hypothetical protein [Flavobacteriaceae bacterium]